MHTIGNRRSPPLIARALTAALTAALLLLGLAGSAQAAEAQGVADESRSCCRDVSTWRRTRRSVTWW